MTTGCETTSNDGATIAPPPQTTTVGLEGEIQRAIGVVSGGTYVQLVKQNQRFSFTDNAGTNRSGEYLYGFVVPTFEGFDTTSGVCPSKGILASLTEIVVDRKATAGLSLEVVSGDDKIGKIVELPLLAMTYDEDKGCEIRVNSGGRESAYFPISMAGSNVSVSVSFWATKDTSSDLFEVLTDIGTIVSNETLSALPSKSADDLLNRLITKFDVKKREAFTRTLVFSADEGADVGLKFDIGDVAGQFDSVLRVDLGTRSSLFTAPIHQHPPFASPQSPNTVFGTQVAAGKSVYDFVSGEFGEGAGNLSNWLAVSPENNEKFVDGCATVARSFDKLSLNRWDRAMISYAFYQRKQGRDAFDFTTCFDTSILSDLGEMGVDSASLKKKP